MVNNNVARRAFLALTMAAAAGLVVMTAGGTRAVAGEEVVVGTLGGTLEAAMKKHFYEPFTKQTGITVVLVPVDRAKLLASVEAGEPEMDVANLSGGQMSMWTSRNALEPIDYSAFDKETLAGIPAYLKHEYGVGALIYSIGMAYSTVDFPADNPRPQTWQEFWDVAKFPGPRGLAGCGDRLMSGGTLEFATLADGAALDALYPIDIDKAFDKIKELKPSVGKFWQEGAEAPQALINGELSVSPSFNGRIYTAHQQGAPVDWNWNQSLLQYDYWVVPKASPNAVNAMKLLAFISRGGPQAGFATETSFGPINTEAYKGIPGDLAKWLPGSPENQPRQIVQNYDWWNAQAGNGKTNLENALDACVSALAQ